ncbi:MAG: YbaN family protein [Candidatus Thermoplasmatota archaeon]|nr:YbaN family protein [Candidatus Thermoplasmatota archaeon]
MNASEVEVARNRFARLLWTTAGTLSLAVGVVGIILPVLPTTPFVLIAAACYLRGSKRMYDKLVKNRYFGGYLRDYMEGRGMSKRATIVSMSSLWILILLSVVFATNDLIIRAVLIVVAIAVTIHLLRLRTRT